MSMSHERTPSARGARRIADAARTSSAPGLLMTNQRSMLIEYRTTGGLA
jgi:hypothetical protein